MIVTPMVYDADEVQRRLSGTLDYAFNMIVALDPVLRLTPAEEGVAFMREFVSLQSLEMLLEMLLAKHPSYAAEGEVRLTIAARRETLGPFIETRHRGDQLVPFVRQQLFIRDHVSGIVLGPLATAETEAAVLEHRAFNRGHSLRL